MRVLIIHQYAYLPGGWGNDRSFALARYWVESGAAVDLITSTAYFPPEHPARQQATSRFESAGIQFTVAHVQYKQQSRTWQKIWAYIHFSGFALWQGLWARRPDVVYAISTPPIVGVVGWLLARWHRVPLVYECMDIWPQVPIGMGLIRSQWLACLLLWTSRRIHRAAALNVVLSPQMADQVLERTPLETPWGQWPARNKAPISPDKLLVSYNGTDTHLFRPRENPIASQLNKDNIRPLIILYAGACGAANDVLSWIKLLPQVMAQVQRPMEFHIYGWGKDWPAVQAQVQAWPYVRCYPPVDKVNLAAVMAQADIGIVSFAPFNVLAANSANKFYDYLASGLAVLINYGGWQADWLKQWNCGLSAPMGDSSAWVAALVQLIGDDATRQQMQSNARASAVSAFERSHLFQELTHSVALSTVGKRISRECGQKLCILP
jgi:glycosyltransferase involved in cell wall biosynthesis